MPKLWDETIEAHRRSVREAALDTTAVLIAERGLASVTMSKIARTTGIGRATLYKYFPDVESILVAWHERQVEGHLSHLVRVGTSGDSARDRLEAALQAFALGIRMHGGTELGALLHGGGHVVRAQQRLTDLLSALIAEAVAVGDLRDDVAPAELAAYCIHALSAATNLPSRAAVIRLVRVTLSGLAPNP